MHSFFAIEHCFVRPDRLASFGMAKERLKSPRARLFVALDLPESVRDMVVGWGRRALDDPVLRPLAADSLHITLAFLGYLPDKEIPRLGEIVAASGGRAPRRFPPGEVSPSPADSRETRE